MPHKDKFTRRKYQKDYYQKKRKFDRYDKKITLLKMLGNKCVKCGYNKCSAALEFHHLDPKIKDFTIGQTFRSFDKLLEEAKKCAILCANCHAEEHFRINNGPIV